MGPTCAGKELSVADPARITARGWLEPLAAVTAASVLIVALAVAALPWRELFPDVICYWAAGQLLASGQSPYDVGQQTAVQHAYGWQRETSGFGLYDFLPYYYPPWFGMLWVPLLPLGLQGAKLAWLFVNVEMTLGAGYLLHPAVPRAPRWVPVVLAGLAFFSLACIVLGQTAILILFLAALSWRLLEGGRDAAAGAAMAFLTIKPQLTAVLLLALLLRLAVERRWRVVSSFFLTLGLLALGSTLVLPSWPIQMLRAPGQTPSPTEFYPWIGNAWLLVLKAVGLTGWPLLALYLAAALPFLGAVVWAALARACSTLELMALSLLAAFFVTPYARHYDFAVLLMPLLALVGRRLGFWAGLILALAYVLVPYVQQYLLELYKPLYNPAGLFRWEGTYFWVPLVLTAAWLLGRGKRLAIPARPA
jgi:hypothetical protein